MEFTDHQRLFLSTVCEHLHKNGGWPTYGSLDRELRRYRVDVEDVGRELDGVMHDAFHAPLSGWDPEQIVTMNVSAINMCVENKLYPGQMSGALHAFMAIVKECVKRYDAGQESVPIKSEMFDNYTNLPPKMARIIFSNAYRLAEVDGFYSFTSSNAAPPPGRNRATEWSLTAPNSIRKYRDVETLDDYLDVRRAELEKFMRGVPWINQEAITRPSTVPDYEEIFQAPEAPAMGEIPHAVSAPSAKASPPKVFISYSSKDKGLVDRLKNDLAQAGVDVWLDHERLKPGTRNWQIKIREGIAHAAFVVYAASEAAALSDFVHDEINIARNKGTMVIPFWIRGIDWLDCVPLGFGATQRIDGRDAAYANGLNELLTTLGVAGPPPTPTPTPTAQQPRAPYDLVECPNCGMFNYDWNSLCTACGRQLPRPKPSGN